MSQSWLVSFDIADARRRYRAGKVLLRYGDRVQESVFLCRVLRQQLGDLKLRVAAMIHPGEDGLRIYPVLEFNEASTVAAEIASSPLYYWV